MLVQTSRNLARLIWVHIDEREEENNVDLLRKLYARQIESIDRRLTPFLDLL